MISLPDNSRFPRAQDVAYLDTAAEGLPPVAAAEALDAYWREKSLGTPGRRRLFAAQREAECAASKLLGVAAENVVLLANASEALNLLANSLAWEPGEEVLITDLEFPSNVLVWLRLKKWGVRVRVIPARGGIVSLKDFTSRLSRRTRVVSVSAVSYKTGTRLPFLRELGEEAHRAGALFCVDATQALGRVPVPTAGVDYLVASGYKWLLGTHGIGVVYLSPRLRERLEPATAGWYAVENIFRPDRFETFTPKSGAACLQPGMPNFPACLTLGAGLECLLAAGIERLDRELRPLMAELHAGLGKLGLTVLTPAAPEFASGIVSFAHESGEEIAGALEREKVIVWGGDGRVRISAHLYNTHEDVSRFFAALKSVLRS
jgi:selenocysteine lyase/cysteine desulfurase